MNESPAGQDRLGQLLGRHWFFILNLVLGIYVGLPFLAPVLRPVASGLFK